MTIKLMYITNNPDIAKIAQEAGVDRIFVDLESIGKEKRQPSDSVKSNHTLEDIKNIRLVIDESELLVRINSIHIDSKKEIDKAIENGADIIMLPYFKTVEEVKKFLEYIDGRVKTNLLIETKEAVDNINDILSLPGIDEVHIGLNDLHLSYHLDFMFELLCNGIVEDLCNTFKRFQVPFGIGGFGRLHTGDLPAEKILTEHYRLGSSNAILSRSFYNQNNDKSLQEIRNIFNSGVKEIRQFEKNIDEKSYINNHNSIQQVVKKIVENKYVKV
ncbi:aldolase/citrate lyase family protein [Thomasclavelia sp.]|uniref:aldolase/citrate lyase family protein n=1 Tax=Thomasclavelia sp. TaxID=3025757 RepID=UPI0025E6AEEE|nr:aldolase/citrate lyase family protein [Thomasclavelia sp.]